VGDLRQITCSFIALPIEIQDSLGKLYTGMHLATPQRHVHVKYWYARKKNTTCHHGLREKRAAIRESVSYRWITRGL